MRKTREELKHERSMRASRAAQLGWDRRHAEMAAAGVSILYEQPRPADMYRIMVENLMSGRAHTLLFHPGPRRDNFSVDLDGRP